MLAGLHPRFSVGAGQPANTGAVVSTVQVMTCVQVAALLQPSNAV
jgi:hypothetical protein